jgi:hypothetical protein
MTDEPQLKYSDARLVDCRDLDKFVKMHLEGYGVTWRALDTGSDGYHNGSYQEADVKLGAEVEDDIDQDFDRWLLGGPYHFDAEAEEDEPEYNRRMENIIPGVRDMMQWLCNLGKIPDGKYVVELWW